MIGGPRGLEAVVLVYVALLPLSHLATFSVAGAMANASDLLLAGLVGMGLWSALRDGSKGAWSFSAAQALPYLVLALFGLWAALSGLWGYHPGFAAAKGGAYVALGLGAWVVARSGIPWERVADAWLVGATLALTWLYAAWVAGMLGWAPVATERALYFAGAVHGLPFPRPRGPFLHPNLLGDFLVVTAALLWARWPVLREQIPGAARAGALLLALTLFLTFGSAWVGAGILMVFWAVRTVRERGPDTGIQGIPWRAAAGVAGALGLLMAGGTLLGMLVPLELRTGPLSITTDGLRARIWASATQAVLEAPLLGVGAAPFLAETWGPEGGIRGFALWDAHSVYLSVVGQFGLVGLFLVGTGVGMVVYRLAAIPGRLGRGKVAVLAALAAVALHGVGAAVEDFRHVWLLLGMAGLMSTRPGGEGEASQHGP